MDIALRKSRYYDPQICRFINADEFASTGAGILGCNMFAYCVNNPVIYADSAGTALELVAIPLLTVLAPVVYSVAVATAITVVAVAAVYVIGMAADYASDAIANAKRSKSSSPSSGPVDIGGGAASPTPPGNGNWNNRNNNSKDPKYRGDYTYNRNGIRVDYEYYGSNGNGNVHLHTSSGKYTYDFSAKVFRTQSGAIAPRSIQALTRNQEIMRALYKGLKYIT